MIGEATLNGVPGKGEVQIHENEAGVITSFAVFYPDNPQTLSDFEQLGQADFWGYISSLAQKDFIGASILGIDREKKSVSFMPVTISVKDWIIEALHEKGGTIKVPIRASATPDEDHAYNLLLRHLATNSLLPSVERGEKNPGRVRAEMLGWRIITIRELD